MAAGWRGRLHRRIRTAAADGRHPAELVGVPKRPTAPGCSPPFAAAARGIEPVLSGEEAEAAIDGDRAPSAEYFLALLEERRRQPRDDLLGAARSSRPGRERRPPDRRGGGVDGRPPVRRPGFETTTNLLGNGLARAAAPTPTQLGGPEPPPGDRTLGRRRAAPVSATRSSSTSAPRSEPADLLGEPLGARRPHRRPAGARANRDPARFDAPRRPGPAADAPHHSASVGASITASARGSPGWRARSPSTRCWRASARSSSSTTSRTGGRASRSAGC